MSIQAKYESGLVGWPGEKLAREMFDLVSKNNPNITDGQIPELTTETKKFMGWWATRKLLGKDIPHVYQQTGSCIGASNGNLLNYTQCIEIINGEREEFKYIFFPYHYGASRNIAYGNTGPGDGCTGSAIASAIMKYGSIPDDIEGLPKAKVTTTDWYLTEDIEYAWSGRTRNGWAYTKHTDLGTKHTIKSATRVTTFDEVAKAVCNGYMVNVCSNMGYGGLDSAGFNKYDRNWNHSMTIAGVDLTHSEPYAIIINNWSDVHPRIKDFETDELYPIGCLRVRASHIHKMVQQSDSFIYSSYNGFPARRLDRSKFNLA